MKFRLFQRRRAAATTTALVPVRKRRRPALIALLAAGLMAATPAAPAHASANGQSFWGGNIPFAGRFIPSGTLTILVHGKGLNIDYMYSNWYGHLCNSRIDWRIYYKGATWWYSKGPVDKGCSVHGYRYRGTGAGPDGSKLCAQVVDDPTGNRYTSACITIKK